MADTYDLILLVFLFGLGTCLAWLIPVSKSRRSKSLRSFCTIAQSAPFSIWIEQNEMIVWQNDFCARYLSDPKKPFLGRAAFEASDTSPPESDTVVYDLKDAPSQVANSYTLQQQQIGSQMVYYAQDATALVETDSALKRFVQTLASTFAHLPIGLAVFDKKRDLTLFNPALSTLLGLAPDWLARQPSMQSFLDRLRNDGAMPEPKDFTTVRHEFAELESGAFTGKYEVDWALPDGHIYRVTGRPHPQGGAALLFEDISRAAALEAKYRSELKQLYAALECLSGAVAIFDQAGELAYANDSFDALWQCSLSSTISPTTVSDVSRVFQKQSEPTPVWGEFRNFVNDLSERSQWQANVTQKNGRELTMIVSPIVDGRVFCEFQDITEYPTQTKLVG
jgi:PAS domain-containing protein